MQIKINLKRFLQFITLFSFITLVPIVNAYNYPNFPDCYYNVDASGLAACCLAGEAGYNGVYCDPGSYIQKIHTTPACTTSAQLLTTASDVSTRGFTGFNCFTNTYDKTCRTAGQCYDNILDTCHASPPDIHGCAVAHQQLECNQSCGQCLAGYISCGGKCVTPVAGICGSGYTLDQCTGKCTCPDTMTPSGIYPNTCITFLARFKEIFDDGLTWLGGIQQIIPVEQSTGGVLNLTQAVYDYTPTNITKTYQPNVYLKSDIAYNLDWSNPNIPTPLQNLINNYYHTCNIANGDADCPVNPVTHVQEKCGTDGLCYSPGGTICTSNSDCDYNYICDDTGHCVQPITPTCKVDADCGAGHQCVNGHCHKSSCVAGCACTTTADCANGFFCNSSLVCESIVDNKTNMDYLGITTAKYTAAFTHSYSDANAVCSAQYGNGAHVCASNEILALYNSGNTNINAETGNGIITSGPPGYTANATDCHGFTKKTLASGEKIYFRWWDFTNKYGMMSECGNNLLGFACCK